MMKRWILSGFLMTLWMASTSVAGGSCSSNSDCNDLNPCTQDVCQIILPPIGICVHTPLSGNTCADDGNVCTLDRCSSGACTHQPSSGNACADDGNICTNDTCSNGVCTHPAHNGIACSNDGNECTNDVCSNGACAHTPRGGFACTDEGNECTNDVCNGSLCTHPPKAAGTVCDDSDSCTDADKCNASGQCVGTPIPGCGGGPCPVEAALDVTPQRDGVLGVLRDYRDVVLGSSVAGRSYTDLYYYHADEVSGILAASPTLRRDVAVALLRFAPNIQAVLDGNDVVLTAADVETIDRLLATVERQAGDELAQDLENVRQTLQKGVLTDVLGVRVEDARPRRR